MPIDDDLDAIGDAWSEIWQAIAEAEFENQEEGAWLCTCGHYQESLLHCEGCDREPPWGCDCGEHEED